MKKLLALFLVAAQLLTALPLLAMATETTSPMALNTELSGTNNTAICIPDFDTYNGITTPKTKEISPFRELHGYGGRAETDITPATYSAPVSTTAPITAQTKVLRSISTMVQAVRQVLPMVTPTTKAVCLTTTEPQFTPILSTIWAIYTM